MSIVLKPNTFSNGLVADAPSVNANFDVIFNDHNGNITDANINATGITTYGKISGSALATLSNIAPGAGVIPAANLPAVSGQVPVGGIIMWSGAIAAIPANWALCNGANSTPDLRNRFIVAADADDSGVAKSTITGAPLQTSDTGVIPAHNHTFNTGSAAGNFAYTYGGNNSGWTGTTNSTGTGTKVIAVFYALAYIMRTA